MEASHSRPSKDAAQAERCALLVRLWAELGKPPVDARLLRILQGRLATAGENHELGPAAMARLLADEGAELKHPEIIESDAEWRQARIENSATTSGVDQLGSPQVLTLETAEKLLGELEELRKRHEPNDDRQALAEIRTFASESRRLAESIARNRSAQQTDRGEQAEIAEWLKVWLQTPKLFADWLELRRRSDEFRARFPALNHEDTKKQS